MKKIIEKIWQDKKTSVMGIFAGVPDIVEGISAKDYGRLLRGVGMLLVGIFAKDS